VFEEAKDSISSVQVIGREIVTGCVDGRMRLYDVRMGMVFVDVVGRKYILCLYRATKIPEPKILLHHISLLQDCGF